jgi:thioredoxin-related protein
MRSLALAFLLVLPLPAAWLTDLDTAKKQAAEEEKGIYLVFTALKFSGACVQLEKRVLSQESFQKAAAEKFVLVHLDVPLQQTPGMISPLAANRIIARKFRVESYPTAFLLDSEGRAYSSETGALIGDPKQYAARLFEKAGEQEGRSKALREAYQNEGLDRAKALIEVLQKVPRDADPALYQEHMTELAKLDPEDLLGFQKKRLAEQGFRDLDRAIKEVFHKDSYNEVVKLVDDYVKQFEPKGTLLQKALFPKLAALNHGGQVPEAIQAADEIIAIAPASSHGKLAAQIRSKLEAR